MMHGRMLRHAALLAGALMAADMGAAASTAPSAPAPAWRTLFDGKLPDTFRGWRSEGMPEGWHVADGLLVKEGDVDDLVTKEQFGNFELELEWRIGKGGNSGIFYRATREYDHIYWSGPEYQLLDDANAHDGLNRLTSAAIGIWVIWAARRRGQAVRPVEQDAHYRQRQSCRALAERPEGR